MRSMGRRAFVGTLVGGLLAAPLAGEAQHAKGPRRIAALLDFSPPPPGSPSLILEALRELGYQDGQNVSLDLRWTDGQRDRSSDLADELVRRSPDVIVTGANESTAAAMRATKTIPIVMVLAVNPVESRLVSSLARPGGNVTGVTVDVGPEIWAKRLEVLKQVAPTVSRVSVLWSPVWGRPPAYWDEVQRGARKFGMTLRSVEVRTPRDVDAALVESGPDRGLIVLGDPITLAQVRPFVDAVHGKGLIAVYGARNWVEAGGLVSYGPDVPALVRRAMALVDRVLKGARPANLPVEQPTKFELVVNAKAARALGLAIPQSLLLRADQVIE
jgi:putative tryptophan/tyrosine transport system substrate-binding protein